MLADKIRYFRDCYEQDNSRSAIWNIFSTSIEHRIPIEGKEELLAGCPGPPFQGARVWKPNRPRIYTAKKKI